GALPGDEDRQLAAAPRALEGAAGAGLASQRVGTMRHKKAGRQFGRDTSSRRAMLRNLAANLITHERIETTDAKAKELRRVAERLITKATRLGKVAYTSHGELSTNDRAKRLHTSRLVSSYVPRWGVRTDGTKIDIVEKVLVDLAKRFE